MRMWCTGCKLPWDVYLGDEELGRLEGKQSFCCEDGLMTTVAPENQGQ